MIKSDFKKQKVEMEGSKANLMTEVVMIIHNLFFNIGCTDDEINLCVKLGMCKDDKEELLNVMIEQIKEEVKKQLEE